jgi:DNA-binding SARP family transcriptional activator
MQPTTQTNRKVPIWQRLTHLLKPPAETARRSFDEIYVEDVDLPDIISSTDEDATQPAPAEDLDATLHIFGLGRFRVRLNHQLVEFGANRKAKSILKYLVLHHTAPVPKEVLMECFWPDADPEDARNNLNVAVYNLRQALRKVESSTSYILFQDDAYLLNPSIKVWIDFEKFMQHCEAAKRFQADGDLMDAVLEYQYAEQLYNGQLFEEDRYEDWPTAHRRFLQDTYMRVLEFLTRQAFESSQYSQCISLSNKMLLVDPCREDAHRCIMQSYSRQGQQYLALRQYKVAVESLKKELDVQPSVELEQLYHKIRTNAAV